MSPGELDPLNRRLSFVRKPDNVVQVVCLAGDDHVQNLLNNEGIHLETLHSISPIIVKPAEVLSKLYSYLGRNLKLGLSGRSNSDVGILTTSKVYKIQDKTFVFTPQSFDRMVNYIDTDPSLAVSTLAYGLNYLSTTWSDPGRPTITLIINRAMIEEGKIPQPFVISLRKLRSGYINGTRVILGSHEQFKATSCVTELAFLGDIERGQPDKLNPEVVMYLEHQLGSGAVSGGVLGRRASTGAAEKMKRGNSGDNIHSASALTGSMKRSRSICPDQSTLKEIQRQVSMEFSPIKEEESEQQGPSIKISRKSTTVDDNKELSGPVTLSVSGVTMRRARFESEAQYVETEVEDLVDMLRSTTDMEAHGDILHHMAGAYGLMFKTSIGVVRDLIR